MSHGGIEFRGEWLRRERRLVRLTVEETDDYLEVHMPRPWVFEKGAIYSVSQPSLCEASADTLGDLLEKIRREATDAMPFTY